MAGCGLGSPSATHNAAAAAATEPAATGSAKSMPGLPPNPCSLAPAATVNAALGTSVGEPARSGEECVYADGANPLAVQIRFASVSLAAFQSVMTTWTGGAKDDVQHLSGIGDDAYAIVARGSPAIVTVYAHKGGTVVTIVCTSPLPKVEALAQEILASVP